jgi:hypothetical protein
MFSFFLPKEINANAVKSHKDVRDALFLAARSGVPIKNIDYFDNNDNYMRFQDILIFELLFEFREGKIARPLGVRLARLGDAYGLNKLFDAERNGKYFSQKTKKQNAN